MANQNAPIAVETDITDTDTYSLSIPEEAKFLFPLVGQKSKEEIISIIELYLAVKTPGELDEFFEKHNNLKPIDNIRLLMNTTVIGELHPKNTILWFKAIQVSEGRGTPIGIWFRGETKLLSLGFADQMLKMGLKIKGDLPTFPAMDRSLMKSIGFTPIYNLEDYTNVVKLFMRYNPKIQLIHENTNDIDFNALLLWIYISLPDIRGYLADYLINGEACTAPVEKKPSKETYKSILTALHEESQFKDFEDLDDNAYSAYLDRVGWRVQQLLSTLPVETDPKNYGLSLEMHQIFMMFIIMTMNKTNMLQGYYNETIGRRFQAIIVQSTGCSFNKQDCIAYFSFELFKKLSDKFIFYPRLKQTICTYLLTKVNKTAQEEYYLTILEGTQMSVYAFIYQYLTGPIKTMGLIHNDLKSEVMKFSNSFNKLYATYGSTWRYFKLLSPRNPDYDNKHWPKLAAVALCYTQCYLKMTNITRVAHRLLRADVSLMKTYMRRIKDEFLLEAVIPQLDVDPNYANFIGVNATKINDAIKNNAELCVGLTQEMDIAVNNYLLALNEKGPSAE